MTAYSTDVKSNRCYASAAVACASAHIGRILDTAILAVSILLSCIIFVLCT